MAVGTAGSHDGKGSTMTRDWDALAREAGLPPFEEYDGHAREWKSRIVDSLRQDNRVIVAVSTNASGQRVAGLADGTTAIVGRRARVGGSPDA